MKKFYFSVILLFILISTAQAQWQKVTSLSWGSYYGLCMDAIGDDFAVCDYPSKKIAITTDAGITWTAKNVPDGIVDIALASKNVFYVATMSSLYKTTNGGDTWTAVFNNPSLTSMLDYVEMFGETKGIALGDGPSSSLNNTLVLRTTDGISWQQTCQQAVGLSGDRWTRIDFIDENSGYFFRGMTTPGQEMLLKTTDGGVTWTNAYLVRSVYGLKFYDENYGLLSRYDYNTSTNYVDRTTDGGLTWQSFTAAGSSRSSEIEFVPGTPAYVWLGANDGLYFSTDSGKTWTQKIGTVRFDEIAFPTAKTGWALSATNGLYYTNNGGGLISNVAQEKNLPTSFQLFQNYPNPFNPETIIKYQLSKISFVTLKVFDVLGKEVATLVNEFQQPGQYVKTFHGTSLPSGTYFYRLTAGDFSSTQKMVLLK